MKKLSIYKENDEYVIERTNEFNHATKRFFLTESGLFEGLDTYKDIIDEYQLNVSEDLWSKVINYLNTGEIPKSRGGKREGSGRPSLGTTKKVSLTLPDEIWTMIEERKKELDVSQSQILRMIIEGYWNGE